MIIDQKDFNFPDKFALIFNSNLDLLNFTISYYGDDFKILLFPEYSNTKFSHNFNSNFNQYLLVDDNLLFGIKNDSTYLFLINEDTCNQLNKYEIIINNKDNSAFILNEDFLALNSLNKIYLFNIKKNYLLSKTINL